MNGLCSFAFAAGLVIFLTVVYWTGLPGWIAVAAILFISWIVSGVYGWADVSLLAVGAMAMAVVFGLTLRWTLRHRAWQKRIGKDRGETEQKQAQMQALLQQLKDKISLRGIEIDRGMKQYELIKKLAEAVSWQEMTPSLEKALKHFFRAEGWALYLTNEKGDLLPVQHRGSTPSLSAGDLTRKDPYLQKFTVSGPQEPERKALALGMPLWRAHERIGYLVVRLPEVEGDQEATVLSDAAQFSTQLIFGMAKAKLYRELEERSRTDGLTGLSRRGPFDERLREEVARAQSFKSTFSILMIDIDHFKRFNDGYGHQLGDEVLKTVSQRIRECLYETDFIARYGGEEFVCLMPRSQPVGLKMKAEQIRQRVASQPFVIGLEAIQVTISVGIAHFPQDAKTAQEIMEASDRALYAAKAAGRNCVIEASSVRT